LDAPDEGEVEGTCSLERQRGQRCRSIGGDDGACHFVRRGPTEDGADDHQEGCSQGGLGRDRDHEIRRRQREEDNGATAALKVLPRTHGRRSILFFPMALASQGKPHFTLRHLDFLLIICIPSPQS
jgi:hypothetical protein